MVEGAVNGSKHRGVSSGGGVTGLAGGLTEDVFVGGSGQNDVTSPYQRK